jgi:putative heme-binding domain-containing protein
VEGQGGILGPDLSSIGRAMTPEAIVESVLWPKLQVKEGFLLTQITTKDGRIVQGHVAEESAAFVTLKDVAGTPGAPIAKAEIVARRDSGTLMPEGLTAWMSEQQRLDLLRYLFGLGLDE